MLTWQGEIDVSSHRGNPLSLGWTSSRNLLTALGGSRHFRLLAAALVTVLAMLCLAIGVAIFTDTRGLVKWGLGIVWGFNTFVALQLVLVYAASKSTHQGR